MEAKLSAHAWAVACVTERNVLRNHHKYDVHTCYLHDIADEMDIVTEPIRHAPIPDGSPSSVFVVGGEACPGDDEHMFISTVLRRIDFGRIDGLFYFVKYKRWTKKHLSLPRHSYLSSSREEVTFTEM